MSLVRHWMKIKKTRLTLRLTSVFISSRSMRNQLPKDCESKLMESELEETSILNIDLLTTDYQLVIN